jgi:23S rRNA U2552 (ribose-2'-O)-methylase RlmE/FtsJ
MQTDYKFDLEKRIYEIPTNYNNKVPNIKFKLSDKKQTSSDLEEDLLKCKNLINLFPRNKWNFFRDLVNPYEFNNIDKIDYINRAYFKLHEMVKVFNLEDLFKGKEIEYSGLCEFPCGFTKCILDNDFNVKKVNIFSNEENKPKINITDRVNIYTIDITNVEKLKESLKDKVHTSDIVTADGGINENEEYSKKEQIHYKLKLFEICAAMRILKEGGVFIIKFFDITSIASVEMVYFLSFYFKEMYIYKPLTSRPTNSERYIVCKHRLKKECQLHPSNIPVGGLNNLASFLDSPIPMNFLKSIRKINNNIIKTQINNIKFVIHKIDNDTDEKEKQYFLNKKSREQKKFFTQLKVKKY